MRALRLKYIPDEPLDGNVPHGLGEEEPAEGGSGHGAEAGQQEEDAPEAGGVLGGLVAAVLAEENLGVVLVHLDGSSLPETTDA